MRKMHIQLMSNTEINSNLANISSISSEDQSEQDASDFIDSSKLNLDEEIANIISTLEESTFLSVNFHEDDSRTSNNDDNGNEFNEIMSILKDSTPFNLRSFHKSHSALNPNFNLRNSSFIPIYKPVPNKTQKKSYKPHLSL